MDGGTAKGRFDIGRTISRSFSVVRGNAPTFIGLAVILTAPSLLFNYLQLNAAAAADIATGTTGQQWAWIGEYLGSFFVYLISLNLLDAALTHGTLVAMNGGRASFGECLMTGLRHALPLTVIIVLSWIGILLGTLLFIVPGIAVSLMWFVITPVRVAERTPIMDTFSRSTELTKGYRWPLFGLLVIFGALIVVLTIAFSAFIAKLGSVPVALAFNALETVATSLLGAAGIASAYYELRTVKEGIGPEQLAAIFA